MSVFYVELRKLDIAENFGKAAGALSQVQSAKAGEGLGSSTCHFLLQDLASSVPPWA